MEGSSQSLRKPQKLLIDSDVAEAAVAAQQLIQLSESSDEDNSSEKSKGEITYTWAVIEEIFGKEDDQQEMQIYRPKKRRYRSLDSLYRETKPVPFDVHRTNKLT